MIEKLKLDKISYSDIIEKINEIIRFDIMIDKHKLDKICYGINKIIDDINN